MMNNEEAKPYYMAFNNVAIEPIFSLTNAMSPLRFISGTSQIVIQQK